MSRARHTPPKPGQPLSDRECQILDQVSQGRTSDAIGRSLGLTRATVNTYVGRILIKLEARCRAHAVTRGFETGHLHVSAPAGGAS